MKGTGKMQNVECRMQKRASKAWLAVPFIIVHSSFSILFAGCEKHISQANIDAVNSAFDRAENTSRGVIEKTVSPKEVESILGAPSKVETFKMELETHKPVVEGTRYIYEQNGQKIVLHFVDNKLISKAPYFGEAQTGAEKKP